MRKPPTHSWLAGFAPADNPEVAFVVILEEAGFGAQAAGPAAVDILREYFRLTRGKKEPQAETHGR